MIIKNGDSLAYIRGRSEIWNIYKKAADVARELWSEYNLCSAMPRVAEDRGVDTSQASTHTCDKYLISLEQLRTSKYVEEVLTYY